MIFNVSLYLYLKKKQVDYISPISSVPLPTLFNSSLATLKIVENLLYKNKIPFTSISQASGSAILIKMRDGEDVIFSDKKNIDSQISSLQLVLSRLTIEGKRFTSLDFRFDRPIIVFK